MDKDPPSTPPFLIKEVEFLKAHGIKVVVSLEGERPRYWIEGAEVSEGEIVAQAYMLGMPGSDHLQ